MTEADELKALRDEIAALRREVAALRQASQIYPPSYRPQPLSPTVLPAYPGGPWPTTCLATSLVA